MSMEKAAKTMGDWRTIWVGVLAIVSVPAWAGETRGRLKPGGEKIVIQGQLSSMQDRIEELEIQKAYETDPQKVRMLEALINIKKSKMEKIVQDHSL